MGTIRPGTIRFDDDALVARERAQAERLRRAGRGDLARLADDAATSLERQSAGLPVGSGVDWGRRG